MLYFSAISIIYVKKLSVKVEDIKRDEELGGIFMTLEEKMDEVREEGHLKGIGEEARRIASEMKKDGIDVQQIAKITKLSKEEIESL